MKAKGKTKVKPLKAWAGISNGRIDRWTDGFYTTSEDMPALFLSRAKAKVRYELAIPVLIVPLGRPRRGKKRGSK